MNTTRILTKYMDAIRSNVFAKYEKDFASKINFALREGYLQMAHEPQLVSIIEKVIDNIHGMNIEDSNPYFKLLTKAVFIHGNKSHVTFDYYGENIKRELGDIIFIISIIFKGQKYFEKFTINQIKRDKVHKTSIYWDISNKEQLYLLSRFPTFIGVNGSIIPSLEHTLPNYSGCLGSYGLLYKPGDFAFVSATELDSFLGYKKNIKSNDLYNLKYERSQQSFTYSQYFQPDIEEFFYLIDRYYLRYGEKMSLNLFNNYHHAYNTFDFAHKYLTMGIGEPVFMKMGLDNKQSRRFLHELMEVLRVKARRENEEVGEQLSCFANNYFENTYTGNVDDGGNNNFRENIAIDYDGGGIGIVYTTINLGE